MKRKRRQRVVSIFMALLMIVGLIPTDFAVTTAKAATGDTVIGLSVVDAGNALTYSNTSTDLVLDNSTTTGGMGSGGFSSTAFLLLPTATDQNFTLTADVVATTLYGTSGNNGIFFGAFTKDTPIKYCSIGVRGDAGIRSSYLKTDNITYGSGSPKYGGADSAIQKANVTTGLGTVKYSMKVEKTDTAYTVTYTVVGGADNNVTGTSSVLFTAISPDLGAGKSVFPGIAISGVKATVSNLKVVTGTTTLYDQTTAAVPVAGTKATITNVTAVKTTNTVAINWAAANGAGTATTNVEYSSDNGTTWTSVGTVNQDITTISHVLTDLPTGTYLYRVTGDGAAVAATAAVDWIQARKAWATVAAPTATASADSSVATINWAMDIGTDGADSLVVDLMNSANAIVGTKTISTAGTSGTITLPVSASGIYSVNLTAVRAGETDKVVTAAATASYAAPLGATTVVSATGDGAGGVAFVWESVNEASSYTISYKKASEADTAYVTAATGITGTTYKVTGLAVGTEYTFKITTVRSIPAATTDITYNKKVTATVERVWNTAYVGTQAGSNKENGEVTANADGSVYMYASDGKFGSSNDGYAFYYTEVDSSAENFVLKATFNVTKIKDNQSGVGLLVADTLGQVGQYELAAETNYYLAGVSKTEWLTDGVKTSYSCGTNVRKVTGCTDPTGQNAAGRVVDMTSAFQTNLDATQTVNAANIAAGTCQTLYTITLTKDNNGYYATMVGSDNVVHMYDASKLLKQDGEKVYVGLAVSRGTEATFSDISFESRNPASDPVLDPSTWDKEYTPQNLFVFAGGTTGTSNYTYRYYGNWAGQFTLTDGNGNVLVSKYIEANETVTYDTQLVKGTTKFITTIEPDASKVTLVSYDPVVIEKSVTYKTYGNEGQTIVVSADGTSAGKGTDASPFDIYTAVKYAQPGQVIYLKNGTYFLTSAVTIPNSVNGTADNRITLMAQDAGQVILDGSQIPEFGGSILNVNGNYWRVYGLELCNSSDNTKGMGVSGSNNIIEMCNIHDNGTTGLQISRSGGEPKEWWPSNNLIKNCTAYNNCDPLLNDADGFAAKLTVGEGNKFYGCIAYNNIDDGWDLYAKNEIGQGSIGAVIIENSVAYLNGYVPGIVGYGEGNGFKLGGEGLPGAHQLINSVSFNNGGKGIASNNGPDCQVINCTSYNNNFYYATGLNPAKGKSSPNLSLSPLNGSKYNGKTNYVLKNTISLYTFEVGVADDIVTVGGQPSLESDNTYLVKSVSSASGTQLSSGLAVTTSGTTFSVSPSYAALVLKSVNLSGTVLPADIFKSVNTTAVPTRNANGTISMNGLLEISAAYVSLGLGATIVTTGADAVSVAPAKTTVITGDTTHFYLFFTLSIMSGAALVGLFFYDKKKRAFVA